MNNETKYKLIVELKELIINTHINNILDLYKTVQICFNASKVMRFIYSKKELTNFFMNKVKVYEKCIENDSHFFDALEIRRKQIKESQPVFDYNIDLSIFHYLDNEPLYNKIKNKKNMTIKEKELLAESIRHNYSSGYDIFTVYFSNDNLKHIITDLEEIMQWNENNGIFRFINGFLSYYEEKYIDTVELNIDDSIAEIFTFFDFNEYTRNIAEFYDFYYLYKAERITTKFYKLADIQGNMYLHIAYTKVLYDLLEYLYAMDLSEEEIQDYKLSQIDIQLSQNRIYFNDYKELNELSPEPRNLLEYIAISEDIDDLKRILKTKNKEYEHLNQTISNYLSQYFKQIGLFTQGGYPAIKRLLRNHPEWFTPRVNKSNQK